MINVIMCHNECTLRQCEVHVLLIDYWPILLHAQLKIYFTFMKGLHINSDIHVGALTGIMVSIHSDEYFILISCF